MTVGDEVRLSEDEAASLLTCPRCGKRAHEHTALSRGLSAACSLDVMGARVAAVERIIAARVQAARAEVLEQAAGRILNWRFEEPDRADVLDELLRLGNDMASRAAALRRGDEDD